MELAALILSGLSLVITVVLLILLLTKKEKESLSEETVRRIVADESAKGNSELRQELTRTMQTSVKMMADMSAEAQKNGFTAQSESIKQMGAATSDMLRQFEARLKTLETTNEEKLSAMRTTISMQLTEMREANDNRLKEIQTTVDEKLQKTLEDRMTKSFQTVSERLEQVYRGLGEMQTLASGVGDLKKVLSNVKTRGILGEIQLGAILSEILSPEQYEYNVAVVPNARERVEYAVKLPGEGGESVWLPIDSKFPGDTYAHLQDAYESGSREAVDAAVSQLTVAVKKAAKDIHDKYIEPPYTTNFAIMFLPFEGLYAEVVNRGLVEILQRDYNVNIAGPSTMAALLNSLQMGFRTLAIQKRSNEVWQVLGAVKTEFDKFEDVLVKAQNQLQLAGKNLGDLVGTRSNMIRRKLKSVEKLDEVTSARLLELDSAEDMVEV